MDLTRLALITQWVGTLLTVCLLLFLAQSIRRVLLWYWSAGWVALAVSLASLTLAFQRPALEVPFEVLYFFGEYVFAYFLIEGCHNFTTGRRITRRSLVWLLLGAGAAVVLALVSRDFNVQFAAHAAILGGCFTVAYRSLAPARRAGMGGGVTVISVALLLLALDFLVDVPVFIVAARLGRAHRFAYLDYTSLVDSLFEVLLGFGMVIVVLDTLRREAESANAELASALGRLEIAARTDPLTNALNRHAYHALVGGSPERSMIMSGCVVIADVDHLKQINDTMGHAAGDVAIRCVASALRSVIRGDDLLFRWGGDEFLVVLWNMEESEAAKRFEHFEEVTRRFLPAEGSRRGVSVSFGFARFDAAQPLDRSIEIADSIMYEQKARRHTTSV